MEALPLLRELREASPHDSVRDAAIVAVKKIEARSHTLRLRNVSPALLPPGYASTSIEFDADRFPELLSAVERALKGQWDTGDREQLSI